MCEEAILHLTQQCKDDIDYLEQQAEDALSKAEVKDGYCTDVFLQMPKAIRSRAIFLALKKVKDITPSYVQMEQIHKAIEAKRGSVTVTGMIQFCVCLLSTSHVPKGQHRQMTNRFHYKQKRCSQDSQSNLRLKKPQHKDSNPHRIWLKQKWQSNKSANLPEIQKANNQNHLLRLIF